MTAIYVLLGLNILFTLLGLYNFIQAIRAVRHITNILWEKSVQIERDLELVEENIYDTLNQSFRTSR